MNFRHLLALLSAGLLMLSAACGDDDVAPEDASSDAPSEPLAVLLSALEGDDDAIRTYVQVFESAASARGLTDPVRVGERLTNDALPEVESAFPGNVLLLHRFESAGAAQRAFDASASARRAFIASGGSLVVSRMSPQAAQPGLPDFPLLDGAELRAQPPAFLLINAIGFRPEPDVPERINQFFGEAAPLLLAGETAFFATLQKVEELEGEFPFDVLFITEWRDRSTFDGIHADPAFLDAAVRLRNPSLRAFTEQAGTPDGTLR